MTHLKSHSQLVVLPGFDSRSSTHDTHLLHTYYVRVRL